MRRPIAVLRAPAGYGKTTVIRQMVPRWRAAGARVLWLEGGNTAAPFARRWRDLTHGATSEAPMILICDDMQTQDVNEWDEALAASLHALRPHQHVVLAVRREPPAAVWAACRALGAIDVGSEQLRFSVEECRTLLFPRHTTERAVSVSESIHHLTGGWPAAVATAAASVESPGFDDALVPRAGGTSSAGWEMYVREQVLNKQPAPVRGFLCATALLGQISVELCDAVLGHSDSQVMIEGLVAEGLLRPVKDDRGWFDHHPLVAETLRPLSYRDDAVRSHALHREAARWHLHRQDRRRAVAHYLAVGDHLSAAEVVLGSSSSGTPQRDVLQLMGAGATGERGGRAAKVTSALSQRETQVLELVAFGHGNKEIGRQLFVTVATVKAHIYSVFRKLTVASRTAAVAEARRRGILS